MEAFHTLLIHQFAVKLTVGDTAEQQIVMRVPVGNMHVVLVKYLPLVGKIEERLVSAVIQLSLSENLISIRSDLS